MPANEDTAVGKWARSVRKDRRIQTTPFHMIQSVINGEYLTKCGKYMKPKTSWREMEVGITDPYNHDFVYGRVCWSCEG